MVETQGGKIFETQFIDELGKLHCVARVNVRWDRDDKNDVILTKIDHRRPVYPVNIQVTWKLDHADKLEDFIASRDRKKLATDIYLEVERGVSPRHAAACAKRAIKDIQQLKAGARGSFGILVSGDGRIHRYEPATKLVELRRRDHPHLSAHLRKTGVICDLKKSGLAIACGTRKFWAYHSEIVDKRLTRRLGHECWSRPIKDGPIRVTFIPLKDRGDRACSVRLDDA